MPLDGILNTARSLSYYLRKQEVTAHNVANANTDAFKADRLVARQLPGAAFPVPARLLDLEQGAFRETGRPLDVAVDGPGFLVVQTADGERLFRGGSLRLDADGRLVDSHGDPVLAEDGPLTLHGSAVEIRGEGDVLVDGALAGRLRRLRAPDPAALLKEGFGRFRANAPLEAAGHESHLRQGAIEEPNVDPIVAMVELVTLQRAYAANVDALKAMDSVLGAVTNDVGRA